MGGAFNTKSVIHKAQNVCLIKGERGLCRRCGTKGPKTYKQKISCGTKKINKITFLERFFASVPQEK